MERIVKPAKWKCSNRNGIIRILCQTDDEYHLQLGSTASPVRFYCISRHSLRKLDASKPTYSRYLTVEWKGNEKCKVIHIFLRKCLIAGGNFIQKTLGLSNLQMEWHIDFGIKSCAGNVSVELSRHMQELDPLYLFLLAHANPQSRLLQYCQANALIAFGCHVCKVR